MAKSEIPPLGRFERSPLTQLLFDRMADMAPGDVISYADLNRIILGDVQDGERHLLRSAREILLKAGIATDAVTGEGVKRLKPSGAVDVATARIEWISRAARKTSRIAETVKDSSLLDPERKRKLDAVTIIAGTIRLFSSRRFGKKVLRATEEQEALPSSQDVIRASLQVFGR